MKGMVSLRMGNILWRLLREELGIDLAYDDIRYKNRCIV